MRTPTLSWPVIQQIACKMRRLYPISAYVIDTFESALAIELSSDVISPETKQIARFDCLVCGDVAANDDGCCATCGPDRTVKSDFTVLSAEDEKEIKRVVANNSLGDAQADKFSPSSDAVYSVVESLDDVAEQCLDCLKPLEQEREQVKASADDELSITVPAGLNVEWCSPPNPLKKLVEIPLVPCECGGEALFKYNSSLFAYRAFCVASCGAETRHSNKEICRRLWNRAHGVSAVEQVRKLERYDFSYDTGGIDEGSHGRYLDRDDVLAALESVNE